MQVGPRVVSLTLQWLVLSLALPKMRRDFGASLKLLLVLGSHVYQGAGDNLTPNTGTFQSSRFSMSHRLKQKYFRGNNNHNTNRSQIRNRGPCDKKQTNKGPSEVM